MSKDHDYVERLNYSSKAIPDLEYYAKYNHDNGATHSAKWLKKTAKILNDSVKFILPNRAELLDLESYSQQHFNLLKLPYPVCAFEFPAIDAAPDFNTGIETMPSPRRIALCVETNSGVLEDHPNIRGITDRFEEGGVFVFSIYYQGNMWGLYPGGSFIPYSGKVTDRPTTQADKIHSQWAEESGRVPSKKSTNAHFPNMPFVFLPELAEELFVRLNGDETKLKALIGADTADECKALLQACSVINCKNVEIDEVPIPRALQLKRNKKGKSKLYPYKVLAIGQEFYKLHQGKGGQKQAGKKRMHLRRGHIRHYEDGSTTWVRHTTVNASADQKLEKDYRIKKPVADIEA